jgi:hypothetical protein
MPAWSHLFAGLFLERPIHALSCSILIISSTLHFNKLQESINAALSPGTSDKSLTFPLRYSIKMNPAQVFREVSGQKIY